MGIKDEFRKLVHPYEDDEDEYEAEDEYEDGAEADTEEARTARSAPKADRAPSRGGSGAGGSYYEGRSRDAKVVNISASKKSQIILVKPRNVENNQSMREVADYLLAGRTVVINLEPDEKADDKLTTEQKIVMEEEHRKLLYFMSGVAYAVQGDFRRVAKHTYMVMPSTVNMEGNLENEEAKKANPFPTYGE